MAERYIASNRLWMAMAAVRAGRPRGRAEPREDDVRRRLYGRRVGLDDDGDAGTVEMTRSLPGGGRRRRWRGRGRDDEIEAGRGRRRQRRGRGRDDKIDVVD